MALIMECRRHKRSKIHCVFAHVAFDDRAGAPRRFTAKVAVVEKNARPQVLAPVACRRLAEGPRPREEPTPDREVTDAHYQKDQEGPYEQADDRGVGAFRAGRRPLRLRKPHHLRLRCFVVIDLKAGAFKPEDAGKMSFYLAAVDDTP